MSRFWLEIVFKKLPDSACSTSVMNDYEVNFSAPNSIFL